jgi:hypothetical protein
VHWALDMVVQAVQGGELSVAKVAFIGSSVPRSVCGKRLDVGVSGEGEHRTGDDVFAVELVDHVVELLTVEA